MTHQGHLPEEDTDRFPPGEPPAEAPPPAGPHQAPDLTDGLKTPGAGTLPDDDPAGGVEPGTG